MMKIHTLLLLLILQPNWNTQAASFDCAKANSMVEKRICNDATLSDQDDRLAKHYAEFSKFTIDPDALKKDQKAWLKARNRCEDVSCIQSAYQNRLATLDQKIPANGSTKSQAEEPAACLAPQIDWRNYRWMLITGNDMGVCEEMLAYLKSRPADAAPPVCPEDRLPKNGNWARPEYRDISPSEKQRLIQEIPDSSPLIQKHYEKHFKKDYEGDLKRASLVRIVKTDITGDGMPEFLLAYSQFEETNYRKSCARATRCAREDSTFHREIVIGEGDSDAYGLLPMDADGQHIDWAHPAAPDGMAPSLWLGELVFYKKRPYWLTGMSWFQSTHDRFEHTSERADDPYSAAFMLSKVVIGVSSDEPAHFKDIRGMGRLEDPACRFGYFHQANLKKYPPKKRR